MQEIETLGERVRHMLRDAGVSECVAVEVIDTSGVQTRIVDRDAPLLERPAKDFVSIKAKQSAEAAHGLVPDGVVRLTMYQDGEAAAEDNGWDLPPVPRQEALALLESWYKEDAEEQRKTWELLKAALDQDRLSDRKLFHE
jgi:hypothetical protein